MNTEYRSQLSNLLLRASLFPKGICQLDFRIDTEKNYSHFNLLPFFARKIQEKKILFVAKRNNRI